VPNAAKARKWYYPGQNKMEDDDSNRLDEIEQRVDELESESSGASTGLSLGYALGMAIAVVVSWSRNASILWCILHGLLSWAYVIYFAVTR
jgi:tetrahydromethanopterin S-methyltransferase subunit G